MAREYTDADIQRSLADYERLIASRERDPKLQRWISTNHVSSLSADDSELRPGIIETLLRLDFEPAARARCEMYDGDVVHIEEWVDPAGTLVVEVGVDGPSTGRHFVSTYFSDGTAVTVWPSDSLFGDGEVGFRTNVRGSDNLEEDVTTAIAARAAHLAGGDRRGLLAVDVATVELHYEVHARYLHADPIKVATQNFDQSAMLDAVRNGMWQGFAWLKGLQLGGLALLAIWRLWVGDMLIGGGAAVVACIVLVDLIQFWVNRDKFQPDLAEFDRDNLEKMLREQMESETN